MSLRTLRWHRGVYGLGLSHKIHSSLGRMLNKEANTSLQRTPGSYDIYQNQRLITQGNKNSYIVGLNTYRVPDLQTLALPLTRIGYTILAGGGEEEIKVFRLIPD